MTHNTMPHPTVGCLTDPDALRRYLRRAVSMTNGYVSGFIDDDMRMLRNVGALFVGRAAYVWVTKEDDEAHFAPARSYAERIHAEVGEDVVVQAAIFEAIYPAVEQIPIPAWIFEDPGEPVEQRNFVYQDMLGAVRVPAQGQGTPWHGGSVPDLTQPEAFRWFYYRAKRYLQAGYEAIHLGQAHLIAGADPGYRRLQRLCDLIRQAAAEHARRGWVILDAHSHGIAIDGRLLFDFTSRPLSVRGLTDHPGQIALIKRGESIGGQHPGGWRCEHSPTLVEVDNWGGYSLPPGEPDWDNPDRLARHGCWGYDQVCWYARLPREQRAAFLRYGHRWTCLQGADWFFQMPLTRSMGQADLDRGGGKTQHYYRANRFSDACVNGLDDEDAVAATWAEGDVYDRIDPPPADDEPTPDGLAVPQPVTVVGQLQPLLGDVPGDASCPWSRLHHEGHGRFARTFALPLPGRFTFTITAGGTMTDPTNQGGVAGGEPWLLESPDAGTLVRIAFDYQTRSVEAVDAQTGRSLMV